MDEMNKTMEELEVLAEEENEMASMESEKKSCKGLLAGLVVAAGAIIGGVALYKRKKNKKLEDEFLDDYSDEAEDEYPNEEYEEIEDEVVENDGSPEEKKSKKN